MQQDKSCHNSKKLIHLHKMSDIQTTLISDCSLKVCIILNDICHIISRNAPGC